LQHLTMQNGSVMVGISQALPLPWDVWAAEACVNLIVT